MTVVPVEITRHLSQSQLSSVTNCGRAHQLTRLEGIREPPAAWTVKGLVVHELIERWEKGGRAWGPGNVESEFVSTWNKILGREKFKEPDLSRWTRTPRTNNTERDLQLRYADGLKEFEAYIQMALDEADLWRPWGVETAFDIQLPGCDFTIRGYIDMLWAWSDGRVTVVDFKTGSDERENWRQLGLYAYVAREELGLDVTYGQYFYSKLGRYSAWKDLSEYTTEYLAEEYTKLDKIIQQKLFLANPGKKKCFLCGVKQHCKENPYA